VEDLAPFNLSDIIGQSDLIRQIKGFSLSIPLHD